jgi:hypothetical protein
MLYLKHTCTEINKTTLYVVVKKLIGLDIYYASLKKLKVKNDI